MKKILVIFLTLLVSSCSATNNTKRPQADSDTMTQNQEETDKWYCYDGQSHQWQCGRHSASQAELLRAQQISDLRRDATSTQKNSAKVPIHDVPLSPETGTENKKLDIVERDSQNRTIANNYEGPESSLSQFAVQLVAVRSLEALDDYQMKLSNITTQKFSLDQDGNPWYVLFLGIYPSYAEAQSALDIIDPELNLTPWIRPWKPRQGQLIDN